MATEADRFNLPHWLRIVLIGRNPRLTLVRIVVLVVVVFLGRAFVLLPIRVKGPSMLPTYQDNGVNFVNRLAYLNAKPKRGDVVAIRFSGESVMLMKRIIGLPGETVQFHEGAVFIDGQKLAEPYLDLENYPCDWELPSEKIGADEYFVVGDNRAMPARDHKFGRTERFRIVGKIWLCKNLFVSSSSRR
jgi:signal peptidase I